MNDPAPGFYAARDERTVQLGAKEDALSRPVSLVVGADVAASRPAHGAVVALANMLARVHRQLHFTVLSAPRIANGLVLASDLAESIRRTVLAINPHIAMTVSDSTEWVQGAVTGRGWERSSGRA